jgi:hypothetical protein
MAINAARLIEDALLLVGYSAFGDSSEPDAALLASRVLNDMLQEWSANSLINPVIKTVVLDVPARSVDAVGAINYVTVGSDGASTPTALDIPEEIMELIEVKVQLGNVVFNLNKISYNEYLALSIKNAPAVPQYYAYDYQFGSGKIYFHMAAMTGYQVIITYTPRLGTLTSNRGTIALDPLYREALLYNLATRLSPFLAPAGGLDQTIIYHAQHSLKVIKQRNQQSRNRKARPAFYSIGRDGSYWTSPLNTCSQ